MNRVQPPAQPKFRRVNFRPQVELLEDRLVFSIRPLGGSMPLNEPDHSGIYWRMAADAQGNLVVAYVVRGESLNASMNNYDLYVQRYTALGEALGSPIQVYDDPLRAELVPSVAMDSKGNFVVAWESYEFDVDNIVYARAFNADGTPKGDAFRVDADSGHSFQWGTGVVLNDSGEFVITWMDSSAGDVGLAGLVGQRFTGAGEAQGERFIVTTRAWELSTSVAMDAAGNFVVAWAEAGDSEGLGFNYYRVSVQRFTASGDRIGDPLLVARGDHWTHRVAMNPAGDFVVVWTTAHGSNSEDFEIQLHAQRFDSSGDLWGEQVRMPSYRWYHDPRAYATMSDNGNLWVAWDGWERERGLTARLMASDVNGHCTDVIEIAEDRQLWANLGGIGVNRNGEALVLYEDLGGESVPLIQWFESHCDSWGDGVWFQLDRDAPRVEQITINDGDPQRSRINRLTVTFSDMVTIDPGAFGLRRVGAERVDFEVTTSVVNGRTVAELHIAGPLANGKYRLKVRGAKVHGLAGLALDGNGDGLAGGNYVNRFFSLFGDVDGDQDTDGVDVGLFRDAYKSSLGDPRYRWYFDFDGDGRIDHEDRRWLKRS